MHTMPWMSMTKTDAMYAPASVQDIHHHNRLAQLILRADVMEKHERIWRDKDTRDDELRDQIAMRHKHVRFFKGGSRAKSTFQVFVDLINRWQASQLSFQTGQRLQGHKGTKEEHNLQCQWRDHRSWASGLPPVQPLGQP